MKKLLIPCLILFLLPSIGQALILLPTAQITIVKTIDGEDGEFNFQIRDTFLFTEYSEDFSIQTQSTTGSFQANPVVFSSESFNIEEFVPQGWKLQSVHCSGPGLLSGPTFPFGPNIPQIRVEAFANVTCSFHNIKSSAQSPILIIPGIMGTEIFKETEKLWPDVTRMLTTANDRFMDPLSYKEDITPLDTSLSVGQVILEETRFDYTKKLINSLKSQGYEEGKNLFMFPYDWRKSIAEVAGNELREKIDSILQITGGSKVDIIAHSQGGLVIKRLLYDQPAYRPKVGKLIFVGSPHLGAPKAAKALLYGDSMGVEFLRLGLEPEEIKRIGENMPSVHQLLPSESYFEHSTGYLGTIKKVLIGVDKVEIKNYQDTKQWLKDKDLNETLLDSVENFHAPEYDNFDFTGTGIDAYNIVGCQTGTIGQILIKKKDKYTINYRAGDGTVPVISASNVYGTTNYYSLDAEHGTMMTQDSSRHLIQNILQGKTDVPTNITTNSSNCIFEGEQVSVHSPVDLHVYDELGNHLGPNLDGGIEVAIPGAQYDVIGDQKFVFLPPGHQYVVQLDSTLAENEQGKFSLYHSLISAGQVTRTEYYRDVAITPATLATLHLKNNPEFLLDVDVNGDTSTDKSIPPTAVLGLEESEDVTSPISTASLHGTAGQPNFFKSNVAVSLFAQDVDTDELHPSGILDILYSVDGGISFTKYSSPLSFQNAGQHTVQFYAVDKAGNEEDIKTISFTIDKTAPEVTIQFSPILKDIQFTATESNVTIQDNGNTVALTDQAGNKTELIFKESNRAVLLRADLTGLLYNGKAQDISKTKLFFAWGYDKGKLKLLEQNIRAANAFFVSASYKPNQTKLVAFDTSGYVSKTLSGLTLIKVTTSKGNFVWSY